MKNENSKTSSAEFNKLLTAIRKEVSRDDLNIDLARVYNLISKVHSTPVDDEQDKLRRKDEEFVGVLWELFDNIIRAGWMPQGTAHAFKLVCVLFAMVEGILWELKGIDGPMPDMPKPFGEPSGPSS